MSLIKSFALSSDLFSYYQKEIDVTKVDSTEEIIVILVSELHELFLKNNLEILAEKLAECKFHMHGTFEEIKKECSATKIYICDHSPD
jgi:hypothetical protein